MPISHVEFKKAPVAVLNLRNGQVALAIFVAHPHITTTHTPLPSECRQFFIVGETSRIC